MAWDFSIPQRPLCQSIGHQVMVFLGGGRPCGKWVLSEIFNGMLGSAFEGNPGTPPSHPFSSPFPPSPSQRLLCHPLTCEALCFRRPEQRGRATKHSVSENMSPNPPSPLQGRHHGYFPRGMKLTNAQVCRACWRGTQVYSVSSIPSLPASDRQRNRAPSDFTTLAAVAPNENCKTGKMPTHTFRQHCSLTLLFPSPPPWVSILPGPGEAHLFSCPQGLGF